MSIGSQDAQTRAVKWDEQSVRLGQDWTYHLVEAVDTGIMLQHKLAHGSTFPSRVSYSEEFYNNNQQTIHRIERGYPPWPMMVSVKR